MMPIKEMNNLLNDQFIIMRFNKHFIEIEIKALHLFIDWK